MWELICAYQGRVGEMKEMRKTLPLASAHCDSGLGESRVSERAHGQSSLPMNSKMHRASLLLHTRVNSHGKKLLVRQDMVAMPALSLRCALDIVKRHSL